MTDCYTNLWNEEELRCSMMLAPPNLNMVPADMRTETTQDEDCDTFHDWGTEPEVETSNQDTMRWDYPIQLMIPMVKTQSKFFIVFA